MLCTPFVNRIVSKNECLTIFLIQLQNYHNALEININFQFYVLIYIIINVVFSVDK
jgi:hypothetical protein